MTIKEAIEILTEDLKEDKYFLPVDFQDAVRLGIEALKLLKLGRIHGFKYADCPLPGETKE